MSDGDDAARTTLVFQNIPCRYTQEDLKTILDEAGFRGMFDLVYTPRSSTMRTNLGYAFVNFRSTTFAEACSAALDGKPLGNAPASKITTVVFSHNKGGIAALEECRRQKRPKAKAVPLVVDEATEEKRDDKRGHSSSSLLSSSSMSVAPKAAGINVLDVCRRTTQSLAFADPQQSMAATGPQESLAAAAPRQQLIAAPCYDCYFEDVELGDLLLDPEHREADGMPVTSSLHVALTTWGTPSPTTALAERGVSTDQHARQAASASEFIQRWSL